ncbi:MAG TPA: hypothetical protein VE988_26390 [Gemmataceae bacterium]|nr:hypothetical protein [Gemmataceae bacterium]
MLQLNFTTDLKQTLKETTIDLEHPGSILRDFEVVRQYVGTEEVRACGKYNLLPIEAIPILDERLNRPLRLLLKRPQLRSHPYLQGLHLLLRATGLTMVDGVGDRARLRLDDALNEQWNRLNPTEQYFTLMEAAFLHGDDAMIGESSRMFNDSFSQCLNAWLSLPKKGKKFDLRRPTYVYFLARRFYLLALADLFGLFQVEHPSPQVLPWCPAAVNHTLFGDAFFALMNKQDYELLTVNEGETPAFGAWQPILQPYFPQWCENLVLPKPELREGVFIFKLSLGKMWRQIAIPESLTLDDLAAAILEAVDFDDDHLYDFSFRDHLGKTARINHPHCDEGPFTDEFPIGNLPLQPGQSMTFLFDYGDSWKFNVKLEKIDPPNPRMHKPRVVGKQGNAPEQYPEAEW